MIQKLFTREYNEKLLASFGTVVLQGLMTVAVQVLKDAGTELRTRREGTTVRVKATKVKNKKTRTDIDYDNYDSDY